MEMKRKFNKGFSVFLSILFIMAFIPFSRIARSSSSIPDIKVTADKTVINSGINEEFKITYHFQPQPIPMELISPQKDKEIVLVIDTSGSMNDKLKDGKTRLSALKTAGVNFISKFKNQGKTKISIVSYSSRGKLIKDLTYSADAETLISSVNALKAEGGTNMGDGLRLALGVLDNGSNAKKYLVVMTDGEPTFYSYEWTEFFKWGYYRKINKSNSGSDYLVNSSNNYSRGMEYGLIMSGLVKEKNTKNYLIGFSDGINSNKLNTLAGASGGLYREAMDGDEINKIYEDIADEIKADYAVEEVKINFNLPEGISYTGPVNNVQIKDREYSLKLPDIKYKLNITENRYEADSFDISLSFKAEKSGAYLFKGDSWNISYRNLDSTVIKKIFPDITVNVSKLNLQFNLQRSIAGREEGRTDINKEFQMEYKITPMKVPAGTAAKGKEVVLVLDTSTSMEEDLLGNKISSVQDEKITLVKESANKFIEQLKGNNNIKVGIVSFNKGGTAHKAHSGEYLIRSSEKDKLNNIINSLSLKEGANTGDGIRKALWLLEKKNDMEKFIVVIGGGKIDYYSHEKENPENLYKSIDNESDSGGKVAYSLETKSNEEEKPLSELYSLQMSEAVKGQNTVIKPYFIPLGKSSQRDIYSSMADISRGEYIDCQNADAVFFQNVLLRIAEEVRSEFIIKAPFIDVNLPQGLTASQGIRAEIGLSDFVYVYNNESKCYEAEAVKAEISLKGVKLGSYELVNDSILKYKDIENINREIPFKPITINIVDEYLIKQGLFTNNFQEGNTLEEGYLIKQNPIEISEEFSVKAGAYIRTYGEETALKILLNKDINNNIKSIKLNSVIIYKINDDNKLQKLKDVKYYYKKAEENLGEITVNIPIGNSSGHSHYIINYNFEVKKGSETTERLLCSAYASDENKHDDLILEISDLPDVF